MRILSILCFAIDVASCDLQVNTAHRSGTVSDDYVAEAPPEKYRYMLKSTNNVLQALTSEQYGFIATNYVNTDMAPELTAAELQHVSISITKIAGEFNSFKEGQWGFVPEQKDGMNLVHSVKIVEHEKMPMHYIFTYLEGQPNRIVGVTIKQRNGVRAPNEL